MLDITVVPTTKGNYQAVYNGTVIVESSPIPALAACRYFQKQGLDGSLRVYGPNGMLRLTCDIAKAAKLTVKGDRFASYSESDPEIDLEPIVKPPLFDATAVLQPSRAMGSQEPVYTVSQSKVCRSCETDRPLSEYYPHKGSKDGKHYTCKPCLRAKALERKLAA